VVADSWWVEGDTLQVEGPAGTVGLPRSLVLRIERVAVGKRAGAPAPGTAYAAPAPPTSPSDVAGLLSEGTGAIVRKDFETSKARFREALDRDPALVRARVGYAISEIALGNDTAALPVVLDGLHRSPRSAELHELLGDLLDRDERVVEAVASWRRAFEIAPGDRVRDKVLKGERELAAGRDYTFSPAAHFNVRYSGAQGGDFGNEVVQYLESRFRDLASLFRHAPTQPITVLVYPQEQFRDVSQVGPEVLGVYDGKIRVPLGSETRLDDAGRRVLAHELTHAFVHSKTRGSCPRWLHEGLAQKVEGRPLTRADLLSVRSRIGGDAPERWESSGFSYPAALSLVEFLAAERGLDLLVGVLDRLAAGEGIDAALIAVYGDDYRGLCRRWAEALGRDAVARGGR
jgi:hypothetical protein